MPSNPLGLATQRAVFEKTWRERFAFKSATFSLATRPGRPKRYALPSVQEDWELFRAGAKWWSLYPAKPTPRALRTGFEGIWRSHHPKSRYDYAVWLKRDTVWGAGGYRQPMVHFGWEAFKEGAAWARSCRAAARRERSDSSNASEDEKT